MTLKEGSNRTEWHSNAKRLEYSIEALAMSVQFALQKAMNESRTSQKQLAERLGVSPARISQILAHDSGNLTLRTIGRIADALGEEFELFSLKDINELKLRARKTEGNQFSNDGNRFSNVVHFTPCVAKQSWKDTSPANDQFSASDMHQLMAQAVGQ